jgi:hypothetical protein
MIDQTQLKIDILLKEYDTLKSEQSVRIGFRDNLLYVTLTLFGGILAYTFAKDNQGNDLSVLSLLILPWVSLIMGWTYLVNDQKISAIGEYIRENLAKKLAPHLGITEPSEIENILAWEIAHRSDKHRKFRKIQQLVVDEITFVFSGMVALIGFEMLTKNPNCFLQILCGFELILLLALGVEIVIYADLAKGRGTDS